MAFSAGIALATSALSGEEDLRSGGPWVLSLVVFPACSLLCLAFILRNHQRRVSSDAKLSGSAARPAERDARSGPFS